MKTTGIIRRLDDLGRIIIPKEIRRSFGIKEGDPLEIFTSDNGITLVKYDPNPNKEKIALDWLRNMKSKMDSQGVRFIFEGDATVCEGIYNNKRLVGATKRNPSDPFIPAIGMVYAYCRAFNVKNPLEET